MNKINITRHPGVDKLIKENLEIVIDGFYDCFTEHGINSIQIDKYIDGLSDVELNGVYFHYWDEINFYQERFRSTFNYIFKEQFEKRNITPERKINS